MEEGSSAVDILKPEGWRMEEGVEEGEHSERRVIVKVGS